MSTIIIYTNPDHYNMTDEHRHSVEDCQKVVITWSNKNFRDFPWRHTEDPYRIMIAEFMLHRTRAEQVVPVYNSFIEKYPEVYSLSQADINDVRKVTEHLGLHWRSDHFVESARFVVNNYNGIIPDTEDDLRMIPGVGEYVAGAILTVCFYKPYPVVDSNIARFINRVYGLKLTGEIRRKKEITNIARKLFTIENPGKFLFALLDFTATICKAKNPAHLICPLSKECRYFMEHDQQKTEKEHQQAGNFPAR